MKKIINFIFEGYIFMLVLKDPGCESDNLVDESPLSVSSSISLDLTWFACYKYRMACKQRNNYN